MQVRFHSCGVTLLELLFAISIIAILAALAIPSFAAMARGARLTTAVNQLVGDLHFARSTAITRGTPVVLCLSADGIHCAEDVDSPTHKWLIFQASGTKPGTSEVSAVTPLRVGELPEPITVRGTRSAVTYWPATRAGTTATFHLCHEAAPDEGRRVIVSQTGRPRVAEADSGVTVCER